MRGPTTTVLKSLCGGGDEAGARARRRLAEFSFKTGGSYSFSLSKVQEHTNRNVGIILFFSQTVFTLKLQRVSFHISVVVSDPQLLHSP